MVPDVLKDLKDLKHDLELFESATEFKGSTLYWGTSADSGSGNERRGYFLAQIGTEFIQRHQKEVLALAVKTLKEKLETIRTELEHILGYS